MSTRILLVKHNHREDIQETAKLIARDAPDLGIELTSGASAEVKPDLVLALGGDGTILKAAEDAHSLDVPLLGINFGHMGFLAETSADSITQVLRQVASGNYSVDPRMTLRIRIKRSDGTQVEDWALNEAAVVSTDKAHPAEFAFAVDGQVVSTYAADGIILSTPTGSTAYAFSAGGPVVWPDAKAIVMAPLAAHGLFTRPLVVGPSSKLEIGVLPQNRTTATIWLDGRREVLAPAGTSIEVTNGRRPLRLVRLDDTPFSRRLVTKFSLPIEGWRDGDDKTKGKAGRG
mgnify:CR=1 FL=1